MSTYCHSTPPTTERQPIWIVDNGISLMACFALAKFDGTLDFSIPISGAHGLNDFFGDRAKTCMTASALSLSVELLFFPHRLSTHVAPFPRLQTCLWFLLLLPLLMVVVHQTQPSKVIELQQHSPLSNNNSVTTYVHQNDNFTDIFVLTHEERWKLSSTFWIIHNKNFIFFSFRC